MTTVADTGDSGAVIRALAELGGSGIVYHEVFGPHPGQVAESLAGLRAAVSRLARYAAGRVRIGVSPHAPYTVSGALYVVADCEQSGGIRIFRLDRVEGAMLLPERFTIPENFSLDDVLSDGKALSSSGRPRILKVRYSPRIARWIAEREGGETAADGSLTVDHPLVDTGWAIRHVLRYGPDAEVLEPADVREELGRKLESMAKSC